ncbi:hypothetical protein ACJJTC_002703 [Scirpophaga incertulas]
MVLPTEVIIKQEKEENEEVNFTSTSAGIDYGFEIEVKVEDFHCDDKRLSHSNEPLVEKTSDAIDYKALIQDCQQLCSLCNRVFDNRFSLICHQTKHIIIPVKPFTYSIYQCDYCLQYFFHSKLEEHILTCHPTKPVKALTYLKYQCDHCLQYFTNYSMLEEHILAYHLPHKKVGSSKGKENLHQCKYCRKELTFENWYSHEIKLHCSKYKNNKKRFKCATCQLKYRTLTYFKRHFLFIHCGIERSGGYGHIRNAVIREQKNGYVITEFEMRKKLTGNQDEIKCSLCPAVLANKHALKTHVRNCHCEKVSCKLCKSVLKKSYLRNHIRRVHYNDGKVHKCDCGKKFRSPRYLKIHIKNAHSKCP